MFKVVLYQPEIPPNTGNIIRLCANTGCQLHLIQPLGFDLSDRNLRRAGLDYHDATVVTVHKDWPSCRAVLASAHIFALTTRAPGGRPWPSFAAGDAFLLGPETRGLPDEVLAHFEPERRLRLPMVPGSRSLNLSNAAAVVVFEAWRQQGFPGAV